MEIHSDVLRFDPNVEPEQVSTSAVDLRLGNHFTLLEKPTRGTTIVIDLSTGLNIEEIASRFGETREIADDQTFELAPGDFVLAYTKETVTLPDYLAARIEGRSSWARLGISIHQTAPTVHATFTGQLRLEISNVGPFTLLLKPGIKFCQLIVE